MPEGFYFQMETGRVNIEKKRKEKKFYRHHNCNNVTDIKSKDNFCHFVLL